MSLLLASISILMGTALYNSIKSILLSKPASFDVTVLCITVILFLHFYYGGY